MSYKLRQYMSGILLLLLASFIIASISYIADTIPETTISLTSQQQVQNPYVVYSTSAYVNNKSARYDIPINVFFVANNYTCVVTSTAKLNPPANVTGYYYYANTSYTIGSRPATKYNETLYYDCLRFTSSNYMLFNITVYFNRTTTGYIDVYVYYTSNITEALSWTPPLVSGGSISNKLFINFIGWVAGIVIVLEALRRFDIEI